VTSKTNFSNRNKKTDAFFPASKTVLLRSNNVVIIKISQNSSGYKFREDFNNIINQ